MDIIYIFEFIMFMNKYPSTTFKRGKDPNSPAREQKQEAHKR